MPLARISIRKGRTADEKKALLDAVHASMIEALNIPENDRNQRITEYVYEDLIIPPGKTAKYTLVEIIMFPGRSIEAKRHLYQSLVKNLAELGTDPMDVFIVLYEPPMENWGIRGGIPASEVDLGFKVNV
ncbi:MAG: tautomerase family protein [Deltaproteobacteria bacterium]|nr:MAG: tautomerase family protein [Deltaproteobacteria bacterium]